jgi:hypothetical protein
VILGLKINHLAALIRAPFTLTQMFEDHKVPLAQRLEFGNISTATQRNQSEWVESSNIFHLFLSSMPSFLKYQNTQTMHIKSIIHNSIDMMYLKTL